MSTSIKHDDAPAGARSFTTKPRRGTKVRRQRVKAAWLFLAPMLIALTLVAGWPLVRTFSQLHRCVTVRSRRCQPDWL